METISKIRSDLKQIKYYFSRKIIFENNAGTVGINDIQNTIRLYNEAVCSADPRLYDLYVSLYLNDKTQEQLSDELGYTIETISRLNSKLILHLQTKLS